jgi:hypothetical protein
MADNNITLLLSLANHAIHNNSDFQEDCSGADWEAIFDLAKKNRIIPLLYDLADCLFGRGIIPAKIISHWKELAFKSMLSACEKNRLLGKLLEAAQEQGIIFVIFKGSVLADLYPKYTSRESSDTDIFVFPRDGEKAVRLLEDRGFHRDNAVSKEAVPVFVHEKFPYKIELHFSLWEDYSGAKIEALESMKLTDENSLLRVRACKMEITTLGYTEHMIYQLFHTIKHFSLKGANIRYLTDITLYVSRYLHLIDGKRFWDSMEKLGYSRFCENFFSICMYYLGMPGDILAGRTIRMNEDTQEFFMDIVNTGSTFSEVNANWELLNIFTPYFTGEQDVSKKKIKRSIPLLLPSSKYLSKEYAYVQKHTVLLPLAWLHRYIRCAFRWIRHKDNREYAKEKMKIIEHRLILMQKLGLVNGGRE